MKAMASPIRRYYEFGPFRLDVDERVLLREGEPVPLTPKALDTLFVLVESGGRVLEKEDLMKKVWPDSFVEEANLAVNVSLLRKALGESGKSGKYIETVPRRGYRFVADVREVRDEAQRPGPRDDSPTAVIDYETQPPATETHSGQNAGGVAAFNPYTTQPLEMPKITAPDVRPKLLERLGRYWRVAAVVALLLLVTFSAAIYYTFIRQAPYEPPRRVAILPFRNLKPNPDTDYLGFSLADVIITRLADVRALVVRPSPYVYGYRNQEIDPRKVAQELSVEALLMGNFVKEGDDIRITAQLIDVRTNEVLWTGTIDRKYDTLPTVQDGVAREIINGLQLRLTATEAERLGHNIAKDPIAFEYFLRGVERYNADDLNVAAELFEKSIALDDNYAASWAYLGEVYTITSATRFGGREHNEKAQEAFERALELDPKQIEARMWLASLLTNTNRVEQAVPLLRELLAERPNHAQAHWELSYAYRFAGMLQESIEEGERTRQLDSEVRANNSVFNTYFYAGQYDRFLKSLPSREDSGFVIFYRGLGRYYLKDFTRAYNDFNRAYELNPRNLQTQIGKAISYGIADKKQEGLKLLLEVEKKIEESGVADAEGIYKVAQAYAVLGDKESALRVLRRSISGGFFCYPYFQNDALLDSLRNDPEFATLMEMARVRHEEFKSKFF